MKFMPAAVLMALQFIQGPPPGSYRFNDHRPVNQASELALWCRGKAESIYRARNITPYQWTSSYHDYANIFYVSGKLRVHGDDVAVRCRIARGEPEQAALIEIDDP